MREDEVDWQDNWTYPGCLRAETDGYLLGAGPSELAPGEFWWVLLKDWPRIHLRTGVAPTLGAAKAAAEVAAKRQAVLRAKYGADPSDAD